MKTLTQKPDAEQCVVTPQGKRRGWLRFVWHFLEMTIVMTVGMALAATIFMVALNIALGDPIEWEDALIEYPVSALLVVAAGMSLPMIPWMRLRGHGRDRAYEMAVVMAVPAIPLIGLAMIGLVDGAQCGLYCLIAFVAMLGIMLYRRGEYQEGHGRHNS
jgi:hypothetical protein